MLTTLNLLGTALIGVGLYFAIKSTAPLPAETWASQAREVAQETSHRFTRHALILTVLGTLLNSIASLSRLV